MTPTPASSGAARAFTSLIAELDGRVPAAVLCVDSQGTIERAALPATLPLAREGLEGRDLAGFVAERDAAAGFWMEELRRNAHVRLGLATPSSRAQLEISAEVVRIDCPPGAIAHTEWEALERWIDAVALPSLVLEVGGRIRSCNPAAEKLLGQARDALRQRKLASLLCEGPDARRFLHGLDEGEERSAHVRLEQPGRRIQNIEAIARRIAESDGETRGWLLALCPLDADPGEEASQRATLQSLAHDLKSPLSSLRALAELIERDFGTHLDELGRRYLGTLRSSATHVQRLLEDLVEYTRLGCAETECRWVSTSEVLAHLAAELKPRLDERGIRLTLPVDPPTIYANPRRLLQVALNLLLNALDHMGEVEHPEIRVRVQRERAARVLEIRDNGRGLPPELRLLDLFSLGGEWRSRGLGLSIVKRILQAHGGEIEVQSAPGLGATFRARFPNP